MYLGMTLNRLGDFERACHAFQKALDLDQNDCTIYLNYAITLYNNGYASKAKELLKASEPVYEKLDEEEKDQDLED